MILHFEISPPRNLWQPPAKDGGFRSLQVAPGYRLELHADRLADAGAMALTHRGDILVSQPRLGRISLVRRDDDGESATRRVLIDGLRHPQGLALHERWLYIAESDGLSRVPFDHSDGRLAGRYQKIVSGLGDPGEQQARALGVGPDGYLYLSNGASCDRCIEADPQRASILRLPAQGGEPEIYASGLHSSPGFDWSPKDGALYTTDRVPGREDEAPAAGEMTPLAGELNRIQRGAFYGWPLARGHRIPDPEFGAGEGARARIAASVPPVHEFAAYSAPLGIRFLRSRAQPADYRNAALVALHDPGGREAGKVVSLHWDRRGNIQQRDFLWGFPSGEEGEPSRPLALVEDLEGNIFISDDLAGAIYRVRPIPAR